ncbi:hypothetical protein [Sorangium sp. So ce341]|uniref:hypothetical protein n=1 Tax=Sorangium sp. So ce341 TaxID=3133302 RepID=UPI003F6350E9
MPRRSSVVAAPRPGDLPEGAPDGRGPERDAFFGGGILDRLRQRIAVREAPGRVARHAALDEPIHARGEIGPQGPQRREAPFMNAPFSVQPWSAPSPSTASRARESAAPTGHGRPDPASCHARSERADRHGRTM